MNNKIKYGLLILALLIAIICILLLAEGNNKVFFLIPLALLVWIGLGFIDGGMYLGPSKKDL